MVLQGLLKPETAGSIPVRRTRIKEVKMDMDNAAVFLAGSILYALGFTVILIAIIIANNIIHRYWKPVSLFTPESWKAFNPPMEVPHGQKETNKTV